MKIRTGFIAVFAIAAIPLCAYSQTKPAVQMPGDNGKVAVPYQMGKKGDELAFSLEKVEFASRVLTKDREQFPEDGKRLLVVTYAVQNPSAADRQFFAQSFSFTVVSPDDENFVTDGMTGSPIVAYHPDRRDRLSIALKPAQKVRAFAVIQIHPKGPVNKLIVQRGKGTPVLRYDLKDKVKPLAGAFSASKGLDILDVGVGAVAAPFDLGVWDVLVEKVDEVPAPIGDYAPDNGWKWVVLNVNFTNVGMMPATIHSSIITGRFFDAEGDEQPQSWLMLKGSSASPANLTVPPGESVKVRMLYKSPGAAKPGHVVLRDANSLRSVDLKLEPPRLP